MKKVSALSPQNAASCSPVSPPLVYPSRLYGSPWSMEQFMPIPSIHECCKERPGGRQAGRQAVRHTALQEHALLDHDNLIRHGSGLGRRHSLRRCHLVCSRKERERQRERDKSWRREREGPKRGRRRKGRAEWSSQYPAHLPMALCTYRIVHRI